MSSSTRIPEPLPPPPAVFHFIGIGGIGMSGLARILAIWGYTVTGSDAAESAQTQALRAMGIPVVIGHDDPSFAALADIVVTNKRAAANAAVELDAARANGARVIKRGDLLGMAAAERFGIAVAGSHGKSTTSGMLSVALRTLQADPSFAVGAIVAATGTNAEPGAGPHFVVEADEFDRSFHGLFPDVAIITSVAFDHPDIYTDQHDYDASFVEFVRNIRPGGTLIIAGDGAGGQRVHASVMDLHRDDLSVQTFGEHEGADWRLIGDANERRLIDTSGEVHSMPMPMPGKHNARNALAAVAALHAAGFEIDNAIRGVGSFTGIGRRFEIKGEVNDVPVVDDYAHHPEEIAAVLHAAREHYPNRRLVVVHQPHTYSRTWSLMAEFAASLDLADDVVLMEIYGVGESNPHNISSADLAMQMSHSVTLAESPQQAADAVRTILGQDALAVVFTVGAGTVTQVGPLLIGQQVVAPAARAAAPRVSRGVPDKLGDLDVLRDAPMSLFTTMRIGGPADYLVRATSPEALVRAVQIANEHSLPVTVIGGGSNLLVSDAGIAGMVIVARVPGESAAAQVEIADDGDGVSLQAAAMVPSSWLGKFAADAGLAGLDWMVGLPGQVGGAVVNNAGAHGREIIDSLQYLDLVYVDGRQERVSADWLQAGYRSSAIKSARAPRPASVLRACFRLQRGNPDELRALAADHARFRRETQPTGACSGSLFANPDGDFAARLIEAAGLKGYAAGSVHMSPVHANWMINTGGGTATEAWELVEHVRASVRAQLGIDLQTEIERIGRWPEKDETQV